MLENLSTLISDHKQLVDTGQLASDEKIATEERALNVKFPGELKAYLSKWGRVSFGPNDYYGIDDGPFGIAIGTQKARDRFDLPNNFVLICDRDGDESICIDTHVDSSVNGNVIVWDNINKQISRIKSDSFEDFMISELNDFLDWQ